MREIPLTQGIIALVDDDMFDYLNQWKWCAYRGGGNWYAMRRINGQKKSIYMARLIMDAKDNELVDHRKHYPDKVDNQRSNLRIATSSQNNHNHKKRKDNTSGYMGVTWDIRSQKWFVQKCFNGKNHYGGRFDNIIDAVRKSDEMAREFHGAFATLNFPNEVGQLA